MKWFRRKPKIVPTGNVIDMTSTSWGHNLSLMDINERKRTMRFATWHSFTPKVGDDLIWKSRWGVVRGQIVIVESAPSVWDMYFITVRNVRPEDG